MLGTDYPFNFHEQAPVERVREAGFDDAVAAAADPSQRRDLSRHRRAEHAMSSPCDRGAAQRRARRARPGAGRGVLHRGLAPRGREPRGRRPVPARHRRRPSPAGAACGGGRAGDPQRHAARARARGAGRASRRRPSLPAAASCAAPEPLDDPAGGTGLLIRDPRRPADRDRARRRDATPTSARPRTGRSAWPTSCSTATTSTRASASSSRRWASGSPTAPRIMAFLNCNRDHHSIALGDTDNDALNHIAFLMPDLDSVMRGGGRMKDAGHRDRVGPGPARPRRQRLQLLHRPVRRGHRIHRRGRSRSTTATASAAPTTGNGRPAASTSGASRRRRARASRRRSARSSFPPDLHPAETPHEIHHLPARAASRAWASSTATRSSTSTPPSPTCRPTCAPRCAAGVDLVAAARAALASGAPRIALPGLQLAPLDPRARQDRSASASTTSTTPRKAAATSPSTRGSSFAARAR